LIKLNFLNAGVQTKDLRCSSDKITKGNQRFEEITCYNWTCVFFKNNTS